MACLLKAAYRDRTALHRAALPHHAAYGSVERGSADQAGSDPGEQRPSDVFTRFPARSLLK